MLSCAFQMAASWRLRAVWLSKNEAVLLNEAWEAGSRGCSMWWSICRIGIRDQRDTAQTNAALEEERLSVETQGENEYERDR